MQKNLLLRSRTVSQSPPKKPPNWWEFMTSNLIHACVCLCIWMGQQGGHPHFSGTYAVCLPSAIGMDISCDLSWLQYKSDLVLFIFRLQLSVQFCINFTTEGHPGSFWGREDNLASAPFRYPEENQLKKYGDSRTSSKSKLPLSGREGNDNVGYDVWKLSSNCNNKKWITLVNRNEQKFFLHLLQLNYGLS